MLLGYARRGNLAATGLASGMAWGLEGLLGFCWILTDALTSSATAAWIACNSSWMCLIRVIRSSSVFGFEPKVAGCAPCSSAAMRALRAWTMLDRAETVVRCLSMGRASLPARPCMALIYSESCVKARARWY